MDQRSSDEIWRTIEGYKGWYEVSDHGRVRSIDRTIMRSNGVPLRRKGVTMTGTPGMYGHLRVELPGGSRYVHRLVLEAFVGPAPEGMEGCHNDGDPSNNHLSNLRWDHHSSNMADMIEQGRQWQLRKTHCKRGHEFTPENTYNVPTGGRSCKECYRMRRLEYRAPGYQKRSKAHCRNGHEYTPENTSFRSNGYRQCRSCVRDSQQRRRKAAKGRGVNV